MDSKELRKLSRADLIEILIDQSIEMQSLREKLNKVEAAQERRAMAIDKSGSLAEASLKVSGIFEAAEEACREYTENIKFLSERQEEISARLEEESRRKAEQMLEETRIRCEKMESAAKVACAEMTEKAKANAQRYWDELVAKLDAYYDAHAGLRELLAKAEASRKAGKAG